MAKNNKNVNKNVLCKKCTYKHSKDEDLKLWNNILLSYIKSILNGLVHTIASQLVNPNIQTFDYLFDSERVFKSVSLSTLDASSMGMDHSVESIIHAMELARYHFSKAVACAERIVGVGSNGACAIKSADKDFSTSAQRSWTCAQKLCIGSHGSCWPSTCLPWLFVMTGCVGAQAKRVICKRLERSRSKLFHGTTNS